MRPSEAITCCALLAPLIGFAYAWYILFSLPIVDLGYESYRASQFNHPVGYYNFSDIRYAAPPLADLRFRPPVPPIENRAFLQEERSSRICPQDVATWQSSTTQWILQKPASGTAPNTLTVPNQFGTIQKGLLETEDCLFLDVFAPKRAFERRKDIDRGESQGAPVIVWIHGGGYTTGSKALLGEPTSILKRSQIKDPSYDIIFVSINYRLGTLGSVSAPSFKGKENVTTNLGLLDQRMALQWVQDKIHLFGGDKNRVTVMGESALSGSITQHATASENTNIPLIQQAVVQSPMWRSSLPSEFQEQNFQQSHPLANATNLSAARPTQPQHTFGTP
ncbi:Carboxylesterase type B [Neofusicoccum parvum]|uniref:Carboxylesterase type B n=1 Tax=Neofusicoccum parvum TaxID=310453 RepID=A0ACB5S0S3_9PEZI|nr:Carboxylesterase type B [Neofusicoccum parvum]